MEKSAINLVVLKENVYFFYYSKDISLYFVFYQFEYIVSRCDSLVNPAWGL